MGEALTGAQAQGITAAEVEEETAPLAAWIADAVVQLRFSRSEWPNRRL